jgi:hypothetical protein
LNLYNFIFFIDLISVAAQVDESCFSEFATTFGEIYNGRLINK